MNKVQSRDKETSNETYKDKMVKRQRPEDMRDNSMRQSQPKGKKFLERRKVQNAGSLVKSEFL